MVRIRQSVVGVFGLLTIACAAAAPAPTATAMPQPTPTRQVSEPVSVQPTAADAAWWMIPGVSACGIPAVYRLDDGPRTDLGNCAAMLLKPAPEVTMRVGEELDVHITTELPSGEPIYPTPQSSDARVLAVVSTADKTATANYVAMRPGTATLTTTGLCLDSQTLQQTDGSCQVLSVMVTD